MPTPRPTPWRESSSRIPPCRFTRFFLAVANLLQGKRKDARGHLEIYLKENPNDEGAKRLLAEAMGVQPDPEQLQAAQAVLGNQEARPTRSSLRPSPCWRPPSARAPSRPRSRRSSNCLRARSNEPQETAPMGASSTPTWPRACFYKGPRDPPARRTGRRASRRTGSRQSQHRSGGGPSRGRMEGLRGDPRRQAPVRRGGAAVVPVLLLREQPDLARRALANAAETLTGEPERAELAVEGVSWNCGWGRRSRDAPPRCDRVTSG